MWSKQLTELSREHLNYDGTHVKHQSGKFGVLNIDYENKVYTIFIKPDLQENFTFHSVDEMIDAGWAVD